MFDGVDLDESEDCFRDGWKSVEEEGEREWGTKKERTLEDFVLAVFGIEEKKRQFRAWVVGERRVLFYIFPT